MVGADLFSPSMESLAKEMVDKCRGLPLAIVVLGGILSYRKGVDEWQKVKTRLWQHMKNDSVEITHILSLSYNDLSFELKQCFLYIGIFQEDHVIDTEKLMYLWLAEGFIPRIREEHMEDIAENFLHESRSLFQVAETFFNKILTWRIHDLLRDLAAQKAMEVNLFDIYDPRVNSVTPFRHRHAIYAETPRYLSLDFSELKWKDTDAAGLINLQLGMERIRKSYSLKSIGSLKSLTTLFLVCQYGGIEELADLNKLPKSITVLVLQSTGLEEDPMPILGKFPNLKHLELSWAYKGMKITCKGNGFGQLETLKLGNLEKLENWHLDTTAMSLIKSLSVFECPKLKKIPERMEHFAVLDGNQSQSEYYYRFPN
ncbi:hypothetical protein KY284_021426 [Solanum tuberosum]|nr:hypothetical protein KY284_021426 [Solanum tuberosum]